MCKKINENEQEGRAQAHREEPSAASVDGARKDTAEDPLSAKTPQPGIDDEWEPMEAVRFRVYGEEVWTRDVVHHIDARCGVDCPGEKTGHDCRFPLGSDAVGVLIGMNEKSDRLRKVTEALHQVCRYAGKAGRSAEHEDGAGWDEDEVTQNLQKAARDLLAVFKRRKGSPFDDTWEDRAKALEQYLADHTETTTEQLTSFVQACVKAVKWLAPQEQPDADRKPEADLKDVAAVFAVRGNDYYQQLLEAGLGSRAAVCEMGTPEAVDWLMGQIVKEGLDCITASR